MLDLGKTLNTDSERLRKNSVEKDKYKERSIKVGEKKRSLIYTCSISREGTRKSYTDFRI
jgi:hypothetical protein